MQAAASSGVARRISNEAGGSVGMAVPCVRKDDAVRPDLTQRRRTDSTTRTKKTPDTSSEVPGVERNTDGAPLLPCEGVFGQTQRKRWVMDRSGGFSGLSCLSDPDLASCRGKTSHNDR